MPTVNLSIPARPQAYTVHIGPGLLGRLGGLVRDAVPAGRAGIILDEAIEPTHGKIAARALRDAGYDTAVAVMTATERKKTIGTVTALHQTLLDHKLERGQPVVVVGGGITGDVGGFAAATYRRGVPLVQCPTTLLAMVDASVGGKTGVNVPQGKNLIGAFHQPARVIADTDTLATLPDRELRSGLAECVKHGMIRDPDLLQWTHDHADRLLARDADALGELVERNVRIKAAVVMEDERESGVRAHLNFGHTFAHALEAATLYKQFKHGEAVALGMVAATGLAMDTGRCDKGVMRRLLDTLKAVDLPMATPNLPPIAKLMEAMTQDKKVRDGKVRLVLPDRVGHVEIVDDTDPEAVEAAWAGIRG